MSGVCSKQYCNPDDTGCNHEGHMIASNCKYYVDIKFINKRISEQELYLKTLDLTTERGKLIYDSAKAQLDYFISLKQSYNGL